MADEDARRGHGGAELSGGHGQVIGTQAGRFFIGGSEVQAEHGHALLVEAARDLGRGGTRVTAAEAVGDQHHGPWLPVRQVQPPGQPAGARTGKRERSGLGHGDTFLMRNAMTVRQAGAAPFRPVDGTVVPRASGRGKH